MILICNFTILVLLLSLNTSTLDSPQAFYNFKILLLALSLKKYLEKLTLIFESEY